MAHRSRTVRRYRLSALVVVLGATLLGLACAGTSTPIYAPPIEQEPLPDTEPLPYELKIGDTISVMFWGNSELDQELTIRPDGMISLPFIDEVKAADLTPQELDTNLTELYRNELATPEITVIVQTVASNLVWVGGEVEEQGTIELHGKMTLMQALTEAGGLLSSSREKQILLIRTEPDGNKIARMIDIRPVRSGLDPNADVSLQPLDIVFVPRTKIENLAIQTDYLYRIIPIQFRINLVDATIFGD